MSKNYIIKIVLDVLFSEDNVKKLLTRGEKLGFQYLNYSSYNESLLDAPGFSLNGALKKVMQLNDLKDVIGDDIYYLMTRSEGAYFGLSIVPGGEYKDSLSVSFPLLTNWYKEYDDGFEWFDWKRYVDLTTELCQDFPIDTFDLYWV